MEWQTWILAANALVCLLIVVRLMFYQKTGRYQHCQEYIAKLLP